MLIAQNHSQAQTAARVLPLEHADDRVYPYDCDPAYGLAIESRGLGVGR